jgi:hypothetical protein
VTPAQGGAGYHPFEQPVSIPGTGKAEIAASPTPMPGRLVTIVTRTPLVVVGIDAPGRGHPKVKPFSDPAVELAEVDKPRTFSLVPAGPVNVTARREGFKQWSQGYTLAPDGELKVEVPKLEEIRGTVVFRSKEDGVRVEVFDDRGERLAQAQVTGGQARVEARVGTQRVSLRQEGCEPRDERVEFVEGRESTFEADLKVALTKVRFVGAFGGRSVASATVQSAGPGGKFEDVDYIKVEPGVKADDARTLRLAPGSYRVMWRVDGQDRSPVEFTVKRGETTRDVELR